tara:strand:+ start:137 stop:1360 length:1224 start_codon:yes stop_codon:yes gene_type:complete
MIMETRIKSPSSINTQGSSFRHKAIDCLKLIKGKHAIAVGLSGGVDSSLTAALLIEAGWEVQGITLWLMKGQGSCCSDGLIDAAGVCKELGISHHVIDSRANFKKEIVEQLVDGYKQGITPSPCSRCNRSVKFSEMIKWAKTNCDLDRVATGHYARINYSKDSFEDYSLPGESKNREKLLRGLDKNKDQSYFLYDLSQEILAKVVFPLGVLTKEETRKEALRYGLRTAEKPESQDLCLSEHYGSMKAFLDNYLPSRIGNIVLQDGTILGEHDGIEHFTIGQRKGLGISWKFPLHVIALNSTENKVIVGPRSEAGKSECVVGEINWVSISAPSSKINVDVQLRYRSLPVSAQLIPIKATQKDIHKERPHRCILIFKEKQFSITPGQAAVFYTKDVVLGGGLIQAAEST